MTIINKRFHKKLLYICSAIVFFSIASCTETETIAPPELASNRILEYKVVNTSETIYGAINEEEQMITVYLPYYYYLTILQAEVSISDGATIVPESGTYIENLVDVIKGDSTVVYTVTDTDGNAVDYQLQVETQQPELVVDELTTDPDNPTVYYSSVVYMGYDITSTISLTGENMFSSTSNEYLAEVTFISEDGTEIPALLTVNNSTSQIVSTVPYNDNIPDGLYDIRVDIYGQSVTLEYPISIQSPF